MTDKSKTLWKATFTNFGISIVVFGVLLGLLWLAETLFPSLSGRLLQFNNTAWVIGIPGSVIGVTYILSIKNPQNYTGFYAGIVMSILLGVQFLLHGQYDSTVLFLFMFISFQIFSIVNWKKASASEAKSESFSPEFLSMKQMLLSVLVFVVLTLADYMLATFVFLHDSLGDMVLIKLFNGLLISTSVLANFWLIYRKNDAWLYWIFYSVAGIVLFVLLHNIFSIVLFVFFLVINSMAGISWIRSTTKENLGWIGTLRGKK